MGWKWDKPELKRTLEEIVDTATSDGSPRSGKVVLDNDHATAIWGETPEGDPMLVIRVTGYMK